MTSPVDFAFLVAQTFGDQQLEREVLGLFLVHTRALLANLPALGAAAQADAAHRLKGSARGIGAWAVAEAADRFEAADPQGRADALVSLVDAFGAAAAAIEVRTGS